MSNRWAVPSRSTLLACVAGLLAAAPPAAAAESAKTSARACTDRPVRAEITAADVGFVRTYTRCLVKRARHQAHAGMGNNPEINRLARAALKFGTEIQGEDAIQRVDEFVRDGLADQPGSCAYRFYVDDSNTTAGTPLAVARIVRTLAQGRDAGDLMDPRADTAIVTRPGRFGEGRTEGDVALMILSVACIGA